VDQVPMKDVSDIRKLVQAFRENHKALKDENASEAVIRGEYIERLWMLLGWDVHNRNHRSLAEKDVVVEANIATIEGQSLRQRRPDYLFRIDGFPRFIVEAKKCTVDIASDKDAIFQAKTYAWSAQIPFAILTNFERFRLFDTTVKPHYHAPEGEVVADFDLRFEDYEQQWDVLQQTFGRDAVAAGSLEKLLAKIKHVRAGRRIRGIDRMLIDLRGSEPVDKAFLAHLEDFRLRIARELYRENKKAFPEPSTKHGAARLAEAAQRIVDRLVFVRVCEDRGITSYGELREAVNTARDNQRQLYPELVSLFRRFDARYNGYLFKAHFSEDLSLPPGLLVDFIRSLYLPDGPYRFHAIADDILGIIYERFLASAITVTRGLVDAEPKPEVRHAGGVYYTPRFVVDTIVRRVVGPKIEGKGPPAILDVKILDPACGSGSFLIAALEYLYTHCLKCFEADSKSAILETKVKRKKVKKKLGFQDAEGNWHLMPQFRGQILQSCIYGVDIDSQAVEVTIMSLYLKMLEGRLPEHWQRDLLEARLLPPLDNNIRCGNSLISQTDFDRYWEDKFNNLFGGDKDLRFRINAFDWTSHTRGFGRIFQDQQGFDCIIGNPPYIRVQELKKWEPEECEFYKANYKAAAKGNYDIYVVFIEKTLSLLAPDGLLGFICPHKFWQAAYGQAIRAIITKGRHLHSVVDFTDQQVFRGASTYTAIHIFGNISASDSISVARITLLRDGDAQCRALDDGRETEGAARFTAMVPRIADPWCFESVEHVTWKNAVTDSAANRLGDLAQRMFQGIRTSMNRVFVLQGIAPATNTYRSDFLGQEIELEDNLLRPFLQGEDIRRYQIKSPSNVVIVPYRTETRSGIPSLHLYTPAEMMKDSPKTWDYLRACETELRSRERGRMDHDDWYAYVYPKNLDLFGTPRILVRDIIQSGSFALDPIGEHAFVSGYGIVLKDAYSNMLPYFLALLNSRLLTQYLKSISTTLRGGWFRPFPQFMGQLPIRLPKTRNERQLVNHVTTRVTSLITAKRSLADSNLSVRERDQLERQIEAHEKRIDELVCELYGVNEIPE